MQKPRSKRLVAKPVVSKTGLVIENVYCRKCMKTKVPKDFYIATDLVLDSNGYMSICSDCINDMYERALIIEGTIEKTILKLCRILNIVYSESAVLATVNQAQTFADKGKPINGVFGIYKTKILATQKTSLDDRDLSDLTFKEVSGEVIAKLNEGSIESQEYFEETWGLGLNEDDYAYLEKEFAKWKKTTKCDTQSEEVLVREICYKQNEIRKKRIMNENVDGMVKSLQEIMKNSNLTPALQNAASAGKMQECFGVWIRDIEQTTPAEYYKDKSKYKDIDGIDEYNDKYIRRPLQNFVTGSRDFNVGDLEEINDGDTEIDFSNLGE